MMQEISARRSITDFPLELGRDEETNSAMARSGDEV